jgi:hypothetical protein
LRSASSSVTRGSTVTLRAAPFTLRFSVTASGRAPSAPLERSRLPPTSVVAAAETPADFRKLRRENEGCCGLLGGRRLAGHGTTL